MNSRLSLSLSLLLILTASACAPAVTPTAASVVPAAPSATPITNLPASEAAPTQALAPTALPIATSRGPNLEVTDPTTVNLASGQIQLVEFFRFT